MGQVKHNEKVEAELAKYGEKSYLQFPEKLGKSVGSSRELWLGSREDQRTSFLRSTDMLFSAIP